jgi:hypothetical protein
MKEIVISKLQFNRYRDTNHRDYLEGEVGRVAEDAPGLTTREDHGGLILGEIREIARFAATDMTFTFPFVVEFVQRFNIILSLLQHRLCLVTTTEAGTGQESEEN